MANKLRLYVWSDVLNDYNSGAMFALASSVEEAREVIINECIGIYYPGGAVDVGLRGTPEVVEVPKGFAIWGGG